MAYKLSDSGATSFLSTTIANATGDGTVATLICDLAQFNPANEYDPGTGIFTPAPLFGNEQSIYTISAQISLSGILAANTKLRVTIQGGGNDYQELNSFAVFPVTNADGTYSFITNTILQVGSGGGLSMAIAVSGNATANVNIVGLDVANVLCTSLNIIKIA